MKGRATAKARATFGTIAIPTLDLNDLSPGVTVMLLTRSGTTYWITRVKSKHLDGTTTDDAIQGLMITTNSTQPHPVIDPMRIIADRYIHTGSVWKYRKVRDETIGVNTSKIMSIEIVG